MNRAARITHQDFARATAAATKAAGASGVPARIIFRLEKREIEIIVGESGETIPSDPNEWDDE